MRDSASVALNVPSRTTSVVPMECNANTDTMTISGVRFLILVDFNKQKAL
jgi:hypothetical protein